MRADLPLGLGVDPGVRFCGVVLVEQLPNGWRYVAGRTVRTSSKQHLVRRLEDIVHEIWSVSTMSPPRTNAPLAWVGIEDPTRVIAGEQRDGETNFDALRILMVVGVAVAMGVQRSENVELVEPGEVKGAVGAPRDGTKRQVIAAVRRIVQGVPEDISEHEADALGAAIAARKQMQFETAVTRSRKVAP